MGKPILCLDFDGVIHSYTSGWKGAENIPDAPVPGALDFIRAAQEFFDVAIFSSRSNQPGGIDAMRAYLGNLALIDWPNRKTIEYDYPEWFLEIKWPTEKPAAFLTIDDRAMLFTGVWPDAQSLLKFKPWNKR